MGLKGKVYVHKGPMFAGKTSKLLELYQKALDLGLDPLVISHAIDTRYGKNQVVSHDGRKAPCETPTDLSTLNLSRYHIIFVDEAQFRTELMGFCNRAMEMGKIVHIFGLDRDYLLRDFRSVTQLYIIAEQPIDQLTAVCTRCGADATCTARLTDNPDRIMVGSDQYEARCQKCHTIPGQDILQGK
jgi:thymidine kinase